MQTNKFADLHVHTKFSDGTWAPKEVIEEAKKNSLSAIAITDHDCVDAIAESFEIAKSYDIELIPAIELSAETDNADVHILGYMIDWESQVFKKQIKDVCQSRVERIKEIVERLKNYNVNIDINSVFKLSGCGSAGRLHIAQIMLEEGYVSNIKEAFNKYIGDKSPCYVKGFQLSPKEAISMIDEVGGIPILAHPRLLESDELVLDFVDDGIRGLEVYHSDHSQSDSRHYLEMAKKYDLLITGGSDFHGDAKVGSSLGSIKLPYGFVEKLKNAKKR